MLLDLTACERSAFGSDYNKCRVIFKTDGHELFSQEFSREENIAFHHQLDLDWSAGEHDLTFTLRPLMPSQTQLGSLTIRIDSVAVRGPLEPKFWVRPANYSRFFPGDVPETSRSDGCTRGFAAAFLRRKSVSAPIDEVKVNQLSVLAERNILGRRTFSLALPRRWRPRWLLRCFSSVRRAFLRVLRTDTRSSTNTHLLRGCRYSSGRPCPTPNCSARPRNTRSGKTFPLN